MYQTTLASNISLAELFLKLDERETSVAFSNGLADRWQSILAFNPIDSIVIDSTSSTQAFIDFTNKHKQNLVFGFISYELGNQKYQITKETDQKKTRLRFYAYDSYMHELDGEVQCFSVSEQFEKQVLEISKRALKQKIVPKLKLNNTISHSEYKTNFEKIHDYIRAGDIYQINYTHIMSGQTDQDSRSLFAYYLENKPVSYAAYFETETMEVISLSPECFFHEQDRKITTLPIKGTTPRAESSHQDRLNRDQLINSSKEQAELFMIVDLLRNDMGKVCKTNTVKVTDEKVVTGLPNVWHTYATIEGILADDLEPAEAIISMFPGGSITGCPKKRAMEIIAEIENGSRGIYTGSIGYFLPRQESCFNIAIRTLVKENNKFYLGVGGGITIKSQLDDEYQETLAKAAFFDLELD